MPFSLFAFIYPLYKLYVSSLVETNPDMSFLSSAFPLNSPLTTVCVTSSTVSLTFPLISTSLVSDLLV